MEVFSVMDAKKCTGLESLKLQPLPKQRTSNASALVAIYPIAMIQIQI
jgi:hypothetical protein